MSKTSIGGYYFSTRDLVVVATLTALQVVINISTVPFVRSFVHGFLHLPGPGTGQAMFGGFMFTFWVLLAYGITMKRGTALLTTIFTGVIGIFTGVGPLSGFPVLMMDLVSGLACEVGLLMPKGRHIVGGALTSLARFLVFVSIMGFYQGKWLLMSYIPVFSVVGIVSGAVLGGALVVGVLKSFERAGLVRQEAKTS